VLEGVDLITALETYIINVNNVNVNKRTYKNVNDWPCLCTCNVLLCVISH
jgi:hypothetical protein